MKWLWSKRQHSVLRRTTRRARAPAGSPSDSAGALIIGGDYRGLGAVRSLGRHGVPIWVLTDEHQVAGLSRYVQRRLPWPDTSDWERVEFLCGLAARDGLGGWVLIPTGDEVAALIAREPSGSRRILSIDDTRLGHAPVGL